jgi:hypothetical protein
VAELHQTDGGQGKVSAAEPETLRQFQVVGIPYQAPPQGPIPAQAILNSNRWRDDMDTFNKHMVGVQGERIVIMMPPTGPISKREALMLAAWIVTLADDNADFTSFLAAVQE